MSQVTMIAQRSPSSRPKSRSVTLDARRASAPRPGARRPAARQTPALSTRMILVGAVFAVQGFLAGALVGAFVGRFLFPACLGAMLAALGGAWLEGRT